MRIKPGTYQELNAAKLLLTTEDLCKPFRIGCWEQSCFANMIGLILKHIIGVVFNILAAGLAMTAESKIEAREHTKIIKDLWLCSSDPIRYIYCP